MVDHDPRNYSERGPPKDHPTKVWSKLVQWFQRRNLKCELWMDDGRKMMTKADTVPLRPGELKNWLNVYQRVNHIQCS